MPLDDEQNRPSSIKPAPMIADFEAFMKERHSHDPSSADAPSETMDHSAAQPSEPSAAPEPSLASYTHDHSLVQTLMEHSALRPSEDSSVLPDSFGKASNAAPKLRIGDQLMAKGVISKDQLEVALKEQKNTKLLLGQVLIELGFITESALTEIIAENTGVERFDAKNVYLDPAIVKMIPKEVALRNKVVPISMEHNELRIAMVDVYDVIALDAVRRFMPKGTIIRPLFCGETELQDLINRYYDYAISIDGILKEIETGIREKTGILDGNADGYVNPTVRLVNALLIDAVKQGASDLHFEPEGPFLRLRYRIDGQLQQVRTLHRDYWSAIAVRIKIISGMNIAESRIPQDGRITFNALGREVDFRVATQPTVSGENIVMRLLDKSKSILPLEKLGFTDHNMNLLKKLIKRPEGIIIMTGPTGSGKTTTLYSILNYINSTEVNIMTLEDPVEYELPLIRQTNIKEGVISFSSGIKSLMRQDPDIIFIGEVRDEETALNAVRAALTGHQVYTTLHTNDTIGILSRLQDIGVPPHMLAGSLICGVAQRLVRTLCSECKHQRPATPEECRILGKHPSKPPLVYEAVGCPACGYKGYKGRVALVEIMPVDSGLDELITQRASRNQIMEHLLNKGFIPMLEDGITKVLNGQIDVRELIGSVDVTERL